MLADFKKMAEKKEVEWDDEQFQRSEPWVMMQIKALIARNVWDIDKYYQVVLKEDKVIEKAIQVLENKKEYDRLLGK